MKYNNIQPTLHNFGHSFCGGINWIDDGVTLTLSELSQLVSSDRYPYVKINFTTGDPDPGVFSGQMIESISRYQEWLPEHALSHKVDLEAIYS